MKKYIVLVTVLMLVIAGCSVGQSSKKTSKDDLVEALLVEAKYLCTGKGEQTGVKCDFSPDDPKKGTQCLVDLIYDKLSDDQIKQSISEIDKTATYRAVFSRDKVIEELLGSAGFTQETVLKECLPYSYNSQTNDLLEVSSIIRNYIDKENIKNFDSLDTEDLHITFIEKYEDRVHEETLESFEEYNYFIAPSRIAKTEKRLQTHKDSQDYQGYLNYELTLHVVTIENILSNEIILSKINMLNNVCLYAKIIPAQATVYGKQNIHDGDNVIEEYEQACSSNYEGKWVKSL